MLEIAALIRRIRTDKNAFQELLVMMEPSIRKYVRLLYKDDKEDVRAEMALALWEAVMRIQYCENDGECVIFHTDMEKFLKKYDGRKRQIFYQMIFEGKSDTNIANEFAVTRQYANRLRRGKKRWNTRTTRHTVGAVKKEFWEFSRKSDMLSRFW